MCPFAKLAAAFCAGSTLKFPLCSPILSFFLTLTLCIHSRKKLLECHFDLDPPYSETSYSFLGAPGPTPNPRRKSLPSKPLGLPLVKHRLSPLKSLLSARPLCHLFLPWTVPGDWRSLGCVLPSTSPVIHQLASWFSSSAHRSIKVCVFQLFSRHVPSTLDRTATVVI